MRLSTRARYGLRALVALARSAGEPLSSDRLARSEEVSKKYLDHILARLRSAGIVESRRGWGGGYRLARPAADIKVSEVVRVLEGGFGVVPCVDDPAGCAKSGRCSAREVWCTVSAAVHEVLSGLTLAELARGTPPATPPSLMYHI